MRKLKKKKKRRDIFKVVRCSIWQKKKKVRAGNLPAVLKSLCLGTCASALEVFRRLPDDDSELVQVSSFCSSVPSFGGHLSTFTSPVSLLYNTNLTKLSCTYMYNCPGVVVLDVFYKLKI